MLYFYTRSKFFTIYYSLHNLHYVHKVGVGVPKVVVFRFKICGWGWGAKSCGFVRGISQPQLLIASFVRKITTATFCHMHNTTLQYAFIHSYTCITAFMYSFIAIHTYTRMLRNPSVSILLMKFIFLIHHQSTLTSPHSSPSSYCTIIIIIIIAQTPS